MSGEKVTRQIEAQFSSHLLSGYEIHMGETVPFGDAKELPLLQLSDGRADGYFVDNQCMGTYVHGILDNAPFVDFLLQPFADKLAKTDKSFDYQAFKEEQYDRLAEHVRKHVDMEQIYKILTDD
jgi:adenosylcobyric acid synthase